MLFGHGDDHYNSQKEVKINFPAEPHLLNIERQIILK